jgi:hypothetical protein
VGEEEPARGNNIFVENDVTRDVAGDKVKIAIPHE